MVMIHRQPPHAARSRRATHRAQACDLQPKLDALSTATSQPQLTLSTIVGLEPLALTAAMRSFYSLLFQTAGASGFVLLSERIRSADVRRQVSARAARTVGLTHRHIHELLRRPGAGYAELGGILLHSADEVDTLLEI